MLKPNLPPGPKPDALLGNLIAFRKDPLGFYTNCARQYGDVARFRIVNVSVYLLSNPELVEDVLVKRNSNFIKGRVIRSNHSLLGNGLLTSEGDFWRRQRRLSQPAFHRNLIAAYVKVIAQFTDQMTVSWRDGEVRDIQQDMKHMTTEIIAKILFDAEVTKEVDEIGAALKVAREELTARMRFGLLIPENIPTPGNLRFKRSVNQLDKIVLRIIRQRRSDGIRGGDLLSSLLAAQDEDGSKMTDHQLRDEVMTLFVAGHETTALALTWAIFLLSENPDVINHLHDEVDQLAWKLLPDINDISCLRYTEMVAKEVLKLHPPSWTIPRQAIHDCEIGGYFVPAGTSLTISQWVMHRDPRFFESPDEFRPERWANDLEKKLPPFVYFPFGGGPRQCIGQSLAMTEIILVLAMLCKNFDFELLTDPKVTPWPSLTIYPRNGIRIRVRRRAS